MKDLTLIARSVLFIAPFFVAIVLIDIFTDKLNILQGEYAPLLYIVPIIGILVFWLYKSTR